MPGNIRKTMWRTKSGKRRVIRLYAAWRNLKGRVNGVQVTGNTREPVWKGLPVHFRDWAHFREWSLENGYCRLRNSLDRIDPLFGYGPDNCRWVSVSENSAAVYMHTLARPEARRDPDFVPF